VFALCDRVDEQPFDERDQLLVETLAGYAALAIAGAEVSHQHSRLALLEERERIGMELHDGIIQSLYGIGMQIELVRSSQTMIPTQALAPVIDSLNDVIEDIRTFITELRQRDQYQKTIRQSVETLLLRLHLPPTLEVVIDAPTTPPPFSPAVYESLLLILNEALSNAVRHANASQLQVVITQDRAYFAIHVIDNGHGFDLSQVGLHADGTPHMSNGSAGLGLQNMQRRARLYGGGVQIETSPHHGTQVTIRIPMRAY
jgi:signal transduction histidine kinase